MLRAERASSVLGLDSSHRMISVALAREIAEETDQREGRRNGRGSGGGSGGGSRIGSALKAFFTSELNEAQLTERLEKDKSQLILKASMQRLKAEEEERENQRYAESLAAATADAEKERRRQARENGLSLDSLVPSSSFFRKLLEKKDKLKPSSEAENYKAQAEIKKAQREHEERAAAAASAASTGPSQHRTHSSDDAALLSEDSGPFIPVKYIQASFEEFDTTNVQPFNLITCCMTLQFIWDLKSKNTTTTQLHTQF